MLREYTRVFVLSGVSYSELMGANFGTNKSILGTDDVAVTVGLRCSSG